jgi:hypothetical protein
MVLLQLQWQHPALASLVLLLARQMLVVLQLAAACLVYRQLLLQLLVLRVMPLPLQAPPL